VSAIAQTKRVGYARQRTTDDERQVSATGLLAILDWNELPSNGPTKTIASLIADGVTQVEIAAGLGFSPTFVAKTVNRLREAMIEQARQHEAELPPGLLERVTRRRR
jgi:hypothetical protein